MLASVVRVSLPQEAPTVGTSRTRGSNWRPFFNRPGLRALFFNRRTARLTADKTC